VALSVIQRVYAEAAFCSAQASHQISLSGGIITELPQDIGKWDTFSAGLCLRCSCDGANTFICDLGGDTRIPRRILFLELDSVQFRLLWSEECLISETCLEASTAVC